MPWTADSFRKKHNHGLTDKQAEEAASIANGVLADTGDEALAIKTANSHVKHGGLRGRLVEMHLSRRKHGRT